MKISLITPTSAMVRNLHLGITSIASFINHYSSHKASIIDYTFHLDNWKNYLIKKLNQQKPDIIGITCQMPYFQYVIKILGLFKDSSINIPVFLGGFHPSIIQDKSISLDGVKGIIIGDGEETILEILDAYEQKKSLTGIKGLIYKNNNNEIIKNELRPFLDVTKYQYYYDWTLWEDLDKFLTIFDYLPFIANRGCVSHCSFCDVHQIKRNVPGRYYREADPEFYVKHIKYQWKKHKDKGFQHAWLYEVVFTFNEKWIKKFCHYYKKEGLDKVLPFSIFSMANHITDKKIKLITETNCKSIRIGVETYDDNIRNNMYNKPVLNRDIINAVNICKKYKIAVTGYFILGRPGETHKSIIKTFLFANKLNIERPTYLVYKPFPNSDLLKILIEKGGKVHEELWENCYFTAIGAIVSTPHLSPKQVEFYFFMFRLVSMIRIIIRQLKKMNFGFFLRYPKFILNGLKTGLSFYWVTYWYFNRLENN